MKGQATSLSTTDYTDPLIISTMLLVHILTIPVRFFHSFLKFQEMEDQRAIQNIIQNTDFYWIWIGGFVAVFLTGFLAMDFRRLLICLKQIRLHGDIVLALL